MNPWEQMLEVQGHDTVLDQLDHRRRAIPERAELDSLPEAYTKLDDEESRRQAERDELARSQRNLEGEVSSLGERREQATAKLYDGSVTAPKELSALQDDIASIDRRIAHLDDQTLELMEQIDPIDSELARLSSERSALDQRAEELQARIAEQEAVIDAERTDVVAMRADAVDGVDQDLLARYDKARGQLGGVAVARLVNGVCDGCHLTLPAVEVDRIKHLPVNEPVTCEECGRFLVR